MTDALHVWLHGRHLGTVHHRPDGAATFAYADPDPSLTPLSVSMPARVDAYGTERIQTWLWGLLPENPAVLQRWARTFQTSAASPARLLATPVGRDCPGAVQFVPDGVQPHRAGAVEWLSEAEVAGRVRSLVADRTAWLGSTTTGQFSLAGMQSKTALLLDRERWGLPTGTTPTTHILKPGITQFDGHDINEHLCLQAARAVGLPAARTHLATFEEQTVLVVARYDRRQADDGQWIRIHQEDLCQATSTLLVGKYQNEGGPTPATIAELLRRVQPAHLAAVDIATFADALVFNWLIAGTDAHAKNYSLVLQDQQVRLAPLYDVSSVLPYEQIDFRGAKLAMKLGGTYRLRGLSGRNLVKMADELGLDGDEVLTRAGHMADQLPDAMAEAVRSDDVARLGHWLPAVLLDRTAQRAASCRAKLDFALP